MFRNSRYLEKAGFGSDGHGGKTPGLIDALGLIEKALLPLAKEKQISLLDAAWEWANQDEEQETSSFQLFHALQVLARANILKSSKLNIDQTPPQQLTLPLFP